jgi:hypothetical protein
VTGTTVAPLAVSEIMLPVNAWCEDPSGLVWVDQSKLYTDDPFPVYEVVEEEELELSPPPPPPQATKSIEANPISNEIFILTIESSIGLLL